MSNNINKMKGATNVKSVSDDMDSFNVVTADVIRDESKWNAFQVPGESDEEEMTHRSVQIHNLSEKEERKVLERAFAFRIGRKAQMVLDAEAA